MKKGLTKRQSDILHFIRKCLQNNNMPPTINEICEEFGFKSTNGVHQHLSALEKKGYLKRISKGSSRGIILTGDEKEKYIPGDTEKSGMKALTIIGSGSAENPLSVFMSGKGIINLDPAYFDLEGENFAVTAPDDAMKSSGISAGDLVIARHNSDPGSGCIVVALVNDLTLIRHFEINGEVKILSADEKGYPKMQFKAEDRSPAVLGTVSAAIKKFDQT